MRARNLIAVLVVMVASTSVVQLAQAAGRCPSSRSSYFSGGYTPFSENAHGQEGTGAKAADYSSLTGNPTTDLSQATIDVLKEDHGIIISTASDASSEPKISGDTASLIAASQFNFVNSGGKLAELSLVHATTTHLGSEKRPIDSEPQEIEPDLLDRLVWVVVFTGFPMTIGGPARLDGSEPPELPANAVLAVFVDPTTGRVLTAAQS